MSSILTKEDELQVRRCFKEQVNLRLEYSLRYTKLTSKISKKAKFLEVIISQPNTLQQVFSIEGIFYKEYEDPFTKEKLRYHDISIHSIVAYVDNNKPYLKDIFVEILRERFQFKATSIETPKHKGSSVHFGYTKLQQLFSIEKEKEQ